MHVLEPRLIFAGGSLVLAGICCVPDVRERRIPNAITLPAMAAGLLLHLIFGGWGGCGNAALAGAIGGGIFLIVCIAGGMGAGDVKLMAAVSCMIGLRALPAVLVATALAGALFALAVSLHRGRLRETVRNMFEVMAHHREHGLTPHPELNVRNAGTLRLPFAVPIAAGCLYMVCAMVWEVQ